MKLVSPTGPVLIACIVFASGCASVTRGTHEVLVVNTTPSQATVQVYRTDRGFTDKALKRNLSEEQYKVKTAENKDKTGSEKFSGPLVAQSPASFSLARNGTYRVEISKPEYEPASLVIKNNVAGGGAAGMAGNVLLGGIIGAGIDAGSGAMLKLVPNPVELELSPAENLDPNADRDSEETPESELQVRAYESAVQETPLSSPVP